MVVAEPYRNRFYKMFDDNMLISDYNLQQPDELGVYELDSIPTNYNAKKPKRYSSGMGFNFGRNSDDNAPDIESEMADRLLVPVFNRMYKQGVRGSKPYFGYCLVCRPRPQRSEGLQSHTAEGAWRSF